MRHLDCSASATVEGNFERRLGARSRGPRLPGRAASLQRAPSLPRLLLLPSPRSCVDHLPYWWAATDHSEQTAFLDGTLRNRLPERAERLLP